MLRSICFVLCSAILLCEGAELLPRSRIHVEQDETIERGTSATISVQRYDGKAFYNYVKLAGEALKDRAETPASGKDENGQVVFSDQDKDDAEIPSTTLTPTSTGGVVVIGSEDVTHPPSGNLHDSPSATDSPSAPSQPAEGGSIPESPPEGGSEPNPGDAVPGQSGEDADAESSSSSSEESSSSSSSSEEDERRNAWEKAWQYKLKNELIMRTGKSKDARKIYSQGSPTRFLKTEKTHRLY